MFAKHGCVPVFFEVGRLSAKGGHAHVQVCPILQTLQSKAEEAFRSEGRQMGIDYEEDPETALQDASLNGLSYFRVDLPDGKKMVHIMKDGVPFSLQFGR